MKLLRYGPPGQEKPGLLDADENIRDLSAHVADIDASTITPAGLTALSAVSADSLPLVEGSPRIGPAVADVGTFHAIGLNYADHAAETGAEPPAEPIVFNKVRSCLNGPNDAVIIPKGAEKVDWEVELAVVIGSRAEYVSEADALDCVAGYAVINDVSERQYQLEGTGQWVKGKSFRSFGPLGPWLVTKDEVPDPQNLDLWLELNGKRYQDGNTRTMIFSVVHIVSYLSRFFTLMPGDVIPTGTPPGVGAGQKPPVFLRPGDVMRVGVEGLGVQEQTVRAWGDES